MWLHRPSRVRIRSHYGYRLVWARSLADLPGQSRPQPVSVSKALIIQANCRNLSHIFRLQGYAFTRFKPVKPDTPAEIRR